VAQDVFISYSTPDKWAADASCSELEKRSVDCWIAPRNILPGQAWDEAIVEAIARCRVMIAVLSSSANSSRHVINELAQATDHRRTVLPLRIEDVPPSPAISYYVKRWNWLDAWPPPLEPHLDQLAESVVRHLRANSQHEHGSVATGPQEATDAQAVGFWEAFDRGGMTIVLGRFLAEFEQFEPSGMVGFGDSMAFAELRTRLEARGIRNFSLSYADFVHGDLLRSNLVLLGGPHANSISREFLEAVKPDLQIGQSSEYDVCVHDLRTGRHFAPRGLRGSARKGTDYAVIIRAPNPFERSKQALFVAGSFGYGTWAGVRMVCSSGFPEHPDVRSGWPVECLVEAQVLRETPLDIRLLICRRLD